MRAASLFSGIGAPEVAMPHWDWIWHAEIDPFAAAVMAERHPQSINLGDVTAPDFVERALDVGRPDVVVFGSPCQSFSVAGKRLGLDDPRGNLALVALRVLQAVRPRWLCFENVPGLLSSADGVDFGTFMRAVAECGYLGCWRVLDAQFAGVPQRRRRVFFVGHLGDWRPAAAVLFEPASLHGYPPPSREAGQGTARPIASSAPGGSGYRNDADTGQGYWNEDDIGQTLVRRETRESTLVAADLRNGALGDLAQTMQSGGMNGERGLSINSLPHVVAYGGNRTSGPRADGFDASEDGTGRGTPLVAMVAEYDTAGSMRAGRIPEHQMVLNTMAVRRLTPKETERLQGLPDDFTLIRYRGKPAADGPRYRAIGNSMAVPVVRWILARIEKAEACPHRERNAETEGALPDPKKEFAPCPGFSFP